MRSSPAMSMLRTESETLVLENSTSSAPDAMMSARVAVSDKLMSRVLSPVTPNSANTSIAMDASIESRGPMPTVPPLAWASDVMLWFPGVVANRIPRRLIVPKEFTVG